MHEESTRACEPNWTARLRGMFRRRSRHAGNGFDSQLPKAEELIPGAAAGIEVDELNQRPAPGVAVIVTCTDYSSERMQVEEIHELADFLAGHRPAWSTVRWIHVRGLSDMTVLRALAEKYDLHPLAIEDVLQVGQRPKVEDYAGSNEHQARLFVIVRMMRLCGRRLASEQLSFFLGRNTLLSFQESCDELWAPVHLRLVKQGSRVRQNDASFLLYTLLDAVVDQCFPILEYYSDTLEDLEDAVLTDAQGATIGNVHHLKRELLVVRRTAWPMREVIHALQRESHECMSEITRTYLRDVYDHCVQVIDLIETYREFATSLTETYMSALSIRMNEIMKVLTIMGTIFIPLTFLAGVYGMNMPIPENRSDWAYPAFWIVSLMTAGTMLVWFRRRGWL
ncbi:MAG TPA: magnesium/cobalt transporter CorA [Pirellulales bacterium]|nr:magnesium/cobalt transporter CorA [Pirellulales bacterium]